MSNASRNQTVGNIAELDAVCILKHFAYVTTPATPSDDRFGIDIICNVYDEEYRPFFVFAMQVKSSEALPAQTTIRRKADVTHLQDMEHIRMPVFWGNYRRKDKTLFVYSLEALDHYFAKYGASASRKFKFVFGKRIGHVHKKLCEQLPGGIFQWRLPLVARIAHSKPLKSPPSSLLQAAWRMLENSQSRHSKEFVLRNVDESLTIYTGSDSLANHNEYLARRLAASLLNVTKANRRRKDRAEELVDPRHEFEILSKFYAQYREVLLDHGMIDSVKLVDKACAKAKERFGA